MSDRSGVNRGRRSLVIASACAGGAAAVATAVPFAASMLPSERAEALGAPVERSEEHTSELQSQSNLVCRLLLEKKKVPDCRVRTIVSVNSTKREYIQRLVP